MTKHGRGRPSSEELAGMTANERFFVLNRLDEFDDAKRRRDRDKMIEIYRDAEITGAERSVDFILAHPERYGL